jgi:6-phosphofructokinase
MKQRIGILTGGGDCPGLNSVIYSTVKAADRRGWETIGIRGGFDGLLSPMQTQPLNYRDMDGLLYTGGTILGTANKGRFSAKVGHGESKGIDPAVLAEAKRNFDAIGLTALVVVGGDGSLSIGLQLMSVGIPVVGVPKTIDNDLEGTSVTFGFDTAVSFATDAIDRLRTHAQSHSRIMVVEMMGRYAGWIATHAGIASGASVVLIPEIPFNYDSVVRKINEREAEGKHFTMVVVAEGARLAGGGYVTQDAPGGKGSGNREGGADMRAGVSPARRRADDLRSSHLHAFRRQRGPVDCRGKIRPHGWLARARHRRRADRRGRGQAAHGAARRGPRAHRPRDGNFVRGLTRAGPARGALALGWLRGDKSGMDLPSRGFRAVRRPPCGFLSPRLREAAAS